MKKLLGAKPLSGHKLMRINLLAIIIAGILHAGDSRISQIAQSINDGRDKQESSKKQVSRFVKNEHISHQEHYLPFVDRILEVLSQQGDLVFSIDGSKIGLGCMALMFSVIYKSRAIPIEWHVYRRKKGHFAEQAHIDLLDVLKQLIPSGSHVYIVGDGKFDGCNWQADIAQMGWDYVLRTAINTQIENSYGVIGILAGIKSYKSKFYNLVAEADQKALSIFQIGLRFIKKLVDQGLVHQMSAGVSSSSQSTCYFFSLHY